ncbi:MAG: alpha-1,2-fucosyltransferase [Gemmatimonadales bacterium]
MIEHGGRLGNQLWNVVAIAAFAAERGYAFRDLSSTSLGSSFPTLSSDQSSRKSPVARVNRMAALLEAKLHSRAVIQPNDSVFYLPPSAQPAAEAAERLTAAEQSASRRLFFKGWPFKNPVGIHKHRHTLLAMLTPHPDLSEAVGQFLQSVRNRSAIVVGLHIRQGDYINWIGGRLAITAAEAARAANEFLEWRRLNVADVGFVLCSDGPLDLDAFANLRVVGGPGEATADLLALSACDWILGSNSTFGGFASYYGDKPFAILERDGIDWTRYADRTGYIEDPRFVMNLLRGIDEGFTADGTFFE